MTRFPCNPFLAIVGIGAATMGATIALHDGTTQRIMPYGWRERPAVARPYRATRPAAAAVPVIVWGECWDWRPFLRGPAWGFAPPGGFGSFGGGYNHAFSGDRFGGGLGVPSSSVRVGLVADDGRSSGDRGGNDAGTLPAVAAPGQAAPQDVPEPAGIACLALALGAMLVGRRARG